MNTLRDPKVVTLLDDLFAAAAETDGPLLAQFQAMAPDARAALMQDYRRLYGEEAVQAYLPISPEGGRLIYTLARATGARTIVEFGTSFGLSTIHLAAALADGGGGQVITTELSEAKAAQAQANLERAGLATLVEIRIGDALETLHALPTTDLVYLDGAKQLYRPVLDRIEPALGPRAVVVADNVDFGALVADYVAYVRDPSQGYVSNCVQLDGGSLEISVRL